MPSAEDQRDRIGAGADADRVRRSHCGRELRFERLDFRAEHEPAAVDDALDRALDVGRVCSFGHERQERHASIRHTRSCRSRGSRY